MFAVIWAWIQNTWFASAYDTDDWIYRLLTMVQMIGVLVLALGLPPMFESIDAGRPRRQRRDGARLRHHARRARSRCGSASPATTSSAVDAHSPTRSRLLVAQIGWIGLLVAEDVDRRDVLGRRGARAYRAERPGHRRAPLRRHARGTRTTSPSGTGC